MASYNETFGLLLRAAIISIATYEHKTTPIIEEDLGKQIGVSGATVERYKSGRVPVEPKRVKILAEAAVRRGVQGREWLQQFLDAARYPERQELLDLLCPLGPARPHLSRVYENMPAPTYSQFVMRKHAFAEILDGLQQRSAAVIIVGMGGNGKTSLAREVASACFDGTVAPRFEAVVWISDTDQVGTTNLSTVLDAIARTLDYRGFIDLEHEDKLYEVEQLLRRQRVLVVVDNFETITDRALLSWVLRLPEPSKALVTTREYRREYRRGGWPVELSGMQDIEARALVSERLRVLKIEHYVNDQAQLEALLDITSGNPMAIEISLGLVKYEHRSLEQIVAELHIAQGKLFDDLFARSWSLLKGTARQILLVMTFFPAGACGEALRDIADIQNLSFESAIDQLMDLSLVQMRHEDLKTARRYNLHPLVYAFAQSKLVEQPIYEHDARERWFTWYTNLIEQCEQMSQDELTVRMEPEQTNALALIQWSMAQQRYTDILNLGPMLGSYYSRQVFWDQLQIVRQYELQAARAIGDVDRELNALRNLLNIRSFQGDMDKVEDIYSRLQTLAQSVSLSEIGKVRYYSAICLYHLQRNEIDAALTCIHPELATNPHFPNHVLSWNRYLYGRCCYEQGEVEKARALFIEAYNAGKERHYTRGMIFARHGLATIALHQQDTDEADRFLQEALLLASQESDRRMRAPVLFACGQLHCVRGDWVRAKANFTEAIELFERLGMRRDLAEARQALTDLETSEAPVA